MIRKHVIDKRGVLLGCQHPSLAFSVLGIHSSHGNESETKQKSNNWGACYNDGSPECLERSPWLFISSHTWLTTHLSIKVSPCIHLCHCSAIFWSVFMIKCCLKDPNGHSHIAILTSNAIPWKLLLFCTNSRASFQVVRHIRLNTDQTTWLTTAKMLRVLFYIGSSGMKAAPWFLATHKPLL